MAAPLEFPYRSFGSVTFDLKRFVSKNALYGGQTQVREQAEARWVAQFTTVALRPGEVRAWRAFWDSLRGGTRSFIAFDPLQAYPLAYPNGFGGLVRAAGGAFDGTASVVSLTLPNQFTIGGLPALFPLAAGDLVELRQGEARGLFRIVAAVTASAGGVAAVTVEPRIVPGFFTVAAVVHLERPSCVMIPEPASWSFTALGGEAPPASFSGIQKIY